MSPMPIAYLAIIIYFSQLILWLFNPNLLSPYPYSMFKYPVSRCWAICYHIFFLTNHIYMSIIMLAFWLLNDVIPANIRDLRKATGILRIPKIPNIADPILYNFAIRYFLKLVLVSWGLPKYVRRFELFSIYPSICV